MAKNEKKKSNPPTKTPHLTINKEKRISKTSGKNNYEKRMIAKNQGAELSKAHF